MTAEAIVRRNRRNARLSTGPRTALGKAIAAGNARSHSATRPGSGFDCAPCLRALPAAMALPSAVLGPVLSRAF